MAERTTSLTEGTRVTHVARPLGRARISTPCLEIGPHLGDLRAFVAACEGLPDDLLVHIQRRHLDVTLVTVRREARNDAKETL